MTPLDIVLAASILVIALLVAWRIFRLTSGGHARKMGQTTNCKERDHENPIHPYRP